MGSQVKEWRQDSPDGVQGKVWKAEFVKRLIGSLEIPTTKLHSSVDLRAYPRYLHIVSLAAEYTRGELLGGVRLIQGASGSLRRCRSVLLGTSFALKSVKVTSESILKVAVCEYETLVQLDHPHIVSVYALFLEPETQEASLVMDLLPGQSLYQLLSEGYEFSGECYIEAEVKSVAQQLFSALFYLKVKDIAHRDLNPANIMLVDSQATLIDFQTACSLTPSGPQGATGTSPFQAPEMWDPAGYGAKVDVWSLGRVLVRLLQSSDSPPSAEARELLDWCSQSDPKKRCSAEQALGSSWLI